MPTELTVETLLPLSIQERKVLILHHALLIDVTHIANEDFHTAYKYGKIISSIAPAYFQYQIAKDRENYSVLELEIQSELIRSKTEKIADNFID